jgi:hypothetical protein
VTTLQLTAPSLATDRFKGEEVANVSEDRVDKIDHAGAQRNTEPVTLSSADSTDRAPWALRPSALSPWRRPRPTRAPCSVRPGSYANNRDARKFSGARSSLFARTSSYSRSLKRGERPHGWSAYRLHPLEVPRQKPLQGLRIQRLSERRRADHVAKQHRHDLPVRAARHRPRLNRGCTGPRRRRGQRSETRESLEPGVP